MKNSSIAESVYRVNLKYVELQNKTKELFFKCLDENRDLKYFHEELKKIWGNLSHAFMNKEINEYEILIHERNTQGKEIVEEEKEGDILDLVPIAVIVAVEKKFVKQKEKEYKISFNSYAYKTDKEDYLKMKVQKYTDQIVPYYSTKTNTKIRDVELSTYCSMIHNTNLTRAEWNQTFRDADMMGQELFFIPYHSFSCPYCMQYQNKKLTRKEAIDIAGHAEEAEGEVLHPNCKCELTFYESRKDFNKPKYSRGELEEQYQIRQKTNSLTLKKEKIKTDIKIQSSLGNQDEVDKLNQQRNKINKEIRNLKEQLPTKQLKKQVVAINR